jgi:hypothetical protein
MLAAKSPQRGAGTPSAAVIWTFSRRHRPGASQPPLSWQSTASASRLRGQATPDQPETGPNPALRRPASRAWGQLTKHRTVRRRMARVAGQERAGAGG